MPETSTPSPTDTTPNNWQDVTNQYSFSLTIFIKNLEHDRRRNDPDFGFLVDTKNVAWQNNPPTKIEIFSENGKVAKLHASFDQTNVDITNQALTDFLAIAGHPVDGGD